MEIEINYCTAWNYQLDADRVSAEVKEAVGVEATLIAGGGGIFDVKRDGVLIFSKHKHGRFPNKGEIADLLK